MANAESATAPTSRRVPAFVGMPLTLGRKLASRLPESANGIRLHGAWLQRRFVIVRYSHPPTRVEQPLAHIDADELDLPTGLAPERFVAEARSFGMRIEALRRRIKTFEIEEDVDGVSHIVHAFHHIAVCGFRGPWPHGPAVVSTPTCQTCLIASAIRPVFRARFHPAVDT